MVIHNFNMGDTISLSCDDGIFRYGTISGMSLENRNFFGYRICINSIKCEFVCGYSCMAKSSRIVLLEKKTFRYLSQN